MLSIRTWTHAHHVSCVCHYLSFRIKHIEKFACVCGKLCQLSNTVNVFVALGLVNSWLTTFWSSVVLFGVDGFAVAIMCLAIVAMPLRMYLARRKYVSGEVL